MIEKNGLKKGLTLVGVLVVFVGAFVLLIDKKKKEEMLGDVNESNFKLKTQEGKQLVVKDMDSSYDKYYVIYFGEDTFDIHAFNYYNNDFEYENGFNNLISNVIDYNKNERMIRLLYTKGLGSYDSVLTNLSSILESSNLKIIN